MTNQWFRSWHGAPTDPKWLGIAKKAGVAPGIVAALVWALLDRASRATERGSIAGYDADGLAYFMGCEPEQVEHVIAVLHEKDVLADDAFTGWEKHQPKREDNSIERVKEHRERKKTNGNADVTHCNAVKRAETLDTDTDTDTDLEKNRTEGLRDASAELENQLRKAAGWENQVSPNLAVTGPIEALIAGGAILETDVLPVVKAHAQRVRRPTSWRYFVPIIQDAVQARREAGTGPPKAGEVVPFTATTNRNINGPRPQTIAAGFDIIDRAIEQRERQLAAAQAGPGRGEDDPVSLP